MSRPLYVLSGLGADARLFDAQRAVREIRPIPWIAPVPSESLAAYAARLAREVAPAVPFDLGGASFGGMVALELARHLAPERVFLFGSCRSPRAIAWPLRILHPLLPWLPIPPPTPLLPLIARWFGAKTPAHTRLFADMLAATPPSFVRWAADAVFSWEGVDDLPMRVHHIHGDRDRVIPVSLVRADHVISGAGHLLNVTHGAEVNDFIVPE